MIEILTSGALNTVQDGGRVGTLALGISRCGAMDRLAWACGNALVGNEAGAAGIEIAFLPFRLRFERAMRVAVTGADCGSTLDGRALPPWWSIAAAAGQVLSLGAPRRGARAYVAVSGGVVVPAVLGSRATDVKGGFGGLQGRGFARGDRLAVGEAAAGPADAGFGVVPPTGDGPLRVIPAAEHDAFDADSRAALTASDWVVGREANRLGYRLSGPVLWLERPTELFSHGIVPGIVQVPANGQPMIQMADANTCGGYPKIATVIEADLWRVAQAPVGTALRFALTDVETALDALRAEAAWLASVRAMVARWLRRAA